VLTVGQFARLQQTTGWGTKRTCHDRIVPRPRVRRFAARLVRNRIPCGFEVWCQQEGLNPLTRGSADFEGIETDCARLLWSAPDCVRRDSGEQANCPLLLSGCTGCARFPVTGRSHAPHNVQDPLGHGRVIEITGFRKRSFRFGNNRRQSCFARHRAF
jgi:hypothetical protein